MIRIVRPMPMQRPPVKVWHHEASIHPVQVSPGERTARLARAGRPITDAGRQDQLRARVRELLASTDNETLAGMLEQCLATGDDYEALRKCVARYKKTVKTGLYEGP